MKINIKDWKTAIEIIVAVLSVIASYIAESSND